MRIFDHAQLTASMQKQAQSLDMLVGWEVANLGRLREAAKHGYPAADYYGVYAVEAGEVLSIVRVIRVPYTTPDGRVERVSGIAGVLTRKDRSKQGLARKLLEEVHERERASGNRFVLLWTGYAIIAHRLYESMGYSDIYTPLLAMKLCDGRPKRPGGYRLRKATKSDLETMEKLYRESSSGRIGFTPRPDGLLKGLVELGLRELGQFQMILRDEEAVGYVSLHKEPMRTRSSEVVLSRRTKMDDVIALLESEAPNRYLSLGGTFVNDALGTLKRRNYLTSNNSYHVLLARRLDGKVSNMTRALGTTDARFSCQSVDYF